MYGQQQQQFPLVPNCPKCGAQTQTKTSKKSGKPYSACGNCKWWAGADRQQQQGGNFQSWQGSNYGPQQQQQYPGPQTYPQKRDSGAMGWGAPPNSNPYVQQSAQPQYTGGQYGPDSKFARPNEGQGEHVGGDDYREPYCEPEPPVPVKPVVVQVPDNSTNQLLLDLFKERLAKDVEILAKLESIQAAIDKLSSKQ